jgi:protein-S-isoprenylcysteine O-methyltransferase Ste14
MMAVAPRASPGVRFPPPTLFVAGFLVALALERWLLSLRFGAGTSPALPLTAWVFIAVGMGLLAWAMLTFRRARTAIMPFNPASTIVTSGPYGFSRNPMYVALTLVYAGLSLLVGTVWPIVVLPIVLWSLYVLVIRREEQYLGAAFAEAYGAYRRRVRRWL